MDYEQQAREIIYPDLRRAYANDKELIAILAGALKLVDDLKRVDNSDSAIRCSPEIPLSDRLAAWRRLRGNPLHRMAR
jgi:hypothetical protein